MSKRLKEIRTELELLREEFNKRIAEIQVQYGKIDGDDSDLVKGRWYIGYNNNSKYFFKYTGQKSEFISGYDCSSWIGDKSNPEGKDAMFNVGGVVEEVIREATEHEMMELLVEEAKRRGLIQGAHVDNTSLGYRFRNVEIVNADYRYNIESDRLTLEGVIIYENDMWAGVSEIYNNFFDWKFKDDEDGGVRIFCEGYEDKGEHLDKDALVDLRDLLLHVDDKTVKELRREMKKLIE